MSESADRPHPEGDRGPASLPVAAGLFCFAFLLRVLPFPRVFTGERIEFAGFDSYYHMRKVLYGVAHFPDWLDFDPYLKFPHGARPIWSPLFDTAVAWLALPFSAAGGPTAVEAVAVLVPPLVGAGTVVAAWALARHVADGGVALACGLLLAVTSAHWWYSQIGFVDHHVAVAALSVALFAATLPLLRRDSLHRPFAAARFGVLAAACLALWPGMLVHLGLFQAALWLHAASGRDRAACARATTHLAWAHAVASVLLLPLWFIAPPEQWGTYSSVVLSRFQPWLAAWLALSAIGATCLWSRTRAGESTVRRISSAIVLGGLGLGASLALLPGLAESFSDAWTWMSKDEAFQASVGESQPLFVSLGRFQTSIAELRFSRLIYLFPVAWLGWCFAWRGRPDSDRSVWGAVALWAGGLAAVTLAQRRFMNSFSVPYALVMAWALVSVGRLARARLPAGAGSRAALVAAGVAALGVALAPLAGAYRGPLSDVSRWASGGAIAPDRSRGDKAPTLLAGEWLRHNTPQTSGYLDPAQRPEYGLLSLWGDGHVLRYTARRPVVTDNFGDDLGPENFELSSRYFAAKDEVEADAILGELGVRYVVVRPGAVSGRHYETLYRRDGTGLAHHRLVFETPTTARVANRPPVKIFERVTGAVIEGAAAAGTIVSASLSYRTSAGRKIRYQVSDFANAQGRYALRVPHATDPAAGVDLRTDEAYRVRAGDVEVPVVVREADVREGRRVPGPAFGGETTRLQTRRLREAGLYTQGAADPR